MEEAWEETKEELENLDREKDFVDKTLQRTQTLLDESRAENTEMEERLAVAEREVALLKREIGWMRDEGLGIHRKSNSESLFLLFLTSDVIDVLYREKYAREPAPDFPVASSREYNAGDSGPAGTHSCRNPLE